MSAITPELGQRLAFHHPIEEILPIEIVADIFILCLPKDPLRHVQPDLTKAPLLLCHVCSVWRTISLNTPQLWNNFYHRLPIPRVSSSDSFWGILPSSLDFMEWWSKNVRGPSLSLRLGLKWFRNRNDWPKNDPTRSTTFLFSMFKSVQFLEIEQSYALILERLQLCPSRYPNLESIVIREDPDDRVYSPWGISSWDVSPWDFSFLRAPSLKKLAIKRFYFYPSSTLPGGRIQDRLTHLFVNLSLSLSEWSSFISGCANLEYARIHLKIIPAIQESNLSATATNQIIIPRLRQVVIDCSSRQLLHVLDNLSLPSLHSLHLLTEASSLYTSSLPYLSISGLARLLSATPSLRVLYIATPFPCKWVSHANGYVTFPPFIPHYQRLGNCAPSLEVLVLEVFKVRPGSGNRGMSPTEYISEMKNSSWLDNVRNPSIPEKLRVILVVDFPRNILNRLKPGEWAIDGVDISAEIRRDFYALELSQKEYPRDRWFEEARCERLI